MDNTLFVLVIVLLVVAVIRELTCWYFKFSAILERLTEIRDLLKDRQAAGPGR